VEIEIRIPWDSGGNLGAAYNRVMQTSVDWVCFLDHDILQLNPNWYLMCCNAVKKVGHDAGWITGMTNAIACSLQYKPHAPTNHSVMAHMDFAKAEYNRHAEKLELMAPNVPLPLITTITSGLKLPDMIVM
jgi:glycosyltransferase involved in cell wall biosynthesis